MTSRDQFERLRAARADTLTDLERATRFLYLQRLAFGGKVKGQAFGVSPGTAARFDVGKLALVLEGVHERLTGVVVECLPYEDLIRRYDRPETLFYLDPPYWGNEEDYGPAVFGREDFAALATMLAGIKGRFILSLNDRPEVRETFAAFQIEPVSLTYSVGGNNSTKAAELLISSS